MLCTRPVQGVTHSMRALIAFLCLSAQVLAVGHHVLIAHEHCAAHGEWVHAQDHADHVAHSGLAGLEPIAVDAEAFDLAARVQAGDAGHADDHDHCTATTDRRKAIQASAHSFGTVAVSVPLVVVLASQVRVVGRALYWAAPKTSPPSA